MGGGEGGAKAVDVSKVEVGRPADAIEVRWKESELLKMSPRLLTCREGGDQEAVNGKREGVKEFQFS